MNIRVVPFLFVLILSVAKLFQLFHENNLFEIIVWISFSFICLWICWAYWLNRNLPAYSGNFKFQEGVNGFPRTVYTLLMASAHFIGFLKG